MVIAFSCSKEISPEAEISDLDTLAIVGDRLITVGDFIRRAEYTIRPDYCAGTNYIHKKIILNSLIAEKLFALDHSGPLDLNNKNIELFLTGRKEQAMRQWYYYDQIFSKLDLDDRSLKKAYSNASKTVNLQYFNIPNIERAKEVNVALENGISFEDIYSIFSSSDSIPERQINWLDKKEDLKVIESIFEGDLLKGKVIGPVIAEDGSILLMKIKGWTERVYISEQDQKKNWEDASNRLKDNRGIAAYETKIKELMYGKQLNFNSEIFETYVNAVSKIYLKEQKQKEEALNADLWEKEAEIRTGPEQGFPEELKTQILFELDGKNYSINDFEDLLKVHPLVFRKKKLNLNEFPFEFQKAVADLLQDLVLTEECYKLGYDKANSVILNLQLWQDAILAESLKWKTIAEQEDSEFHLLEPVKKIEKVLDPMVKEMQVKYGDRIQIDMEKFESIELTRTPMVVIQPGQPFPVIVPQFPIVTTLSRIDYGSDLSKN